MITRLCINNDVCDNHDGEIARFYCMIDKHYICEKCVEEHRDHMVHVDSIKNHLTNLFNEWRALADHAQNVTKPMIDRNTIR